MKEVQLTLTVDEVNLLLEGIGKLPFERVFQLVNKIQRQASDQINQLKETAPKGQDEVEIIDNEK